MSKKQINRRTFIKGAGVATAAGAIAGSASAAPLKDPSEISFLERMRGLSYSEAERQQLFGSLDDMLARTTARRNHAPLENHHAPAHMFDPRLPGKTYHNPDNYVRIVGGEAGPLPSDEDIAFAPMWKQAAWMRADTLSSAQLTDIYLQRITEHEPKLQCFVTVLAEQARAEAYERDLELRSGRDRGPLHGIPYGLKDLVDTAGIPTTWGASPYRDRVPAEDGEIVNRLREAGAVLLGKTSLGALAYGDVWFNGVTKNPWNIEEGASGSSAGSASATAAGLVSFSIGSETLGSIVSPSARCGVTGLKPTFGRVSRAGAMTLCWSLDKLGPICRFVEDAASVLGVLNGGHEGDAGSLEHGFEYDGVAASQQNIRIGYNAKEFEEDATDSDRRALARLREMGFPLVEVEAPDVPYESLLTILEVEAAAAFEELTLSNRDDELVWQGERAWPNTMRAAHFHSAVEYLQLDRVRRKLMQAMARLYETVDVIVSPNFAGNWLMANNYAGAPSLTLPVGLEERGNVLLLTGEMPEDPAEPAPYPHAITLWGNLFREDQLLAVGRLLEESLQFHLNRPKL
jgi:Asp-tRNA(Asn)/Glu-tRNA(Gln) amidotransferase A subunit family amidase